MITPGPWEIVRNRIVGSEAVHTNGLRNPFGIRSASYSEIVCEVHGDLGLEAPLANARLISAAPDLLQACKAILKICPPNTLYGVMPLILAAVAKADPKHKLRKEELMGDEGSNSIVPEPALLSADNIILLARDAERRIEAVKKIKAIAIGVTGAMDWQDQGGKPYLQVSGAHKVGRLFGISWRVGEAVIETNDDGHYVVTYKGEFSWGGATIEAIGARSSREDFFSMRYKGGEKILLPADVVDRGNVKKSAFTNCIGNGVTSLLGIRNLTWSDLAAAGIKRENVGKVEAPKEIPPEIVAKAAELERMLKGMNGESYGDYLEKLTTWKRNGKITPGKRFVSALTEKQIIFLHAKLKKQYDKKQKMETRKAEGKTAEKASDAQKAAIKRLLDKKRIDPEAFKSGFAKPIDQLLASEVNAALKWVEERDDHRKGNRVQAQQDPSVSGPCQPGQ